MNEITTDRLLIYLTYLVFTFMVTLKYFVLILELGFVAQFPTSALHSNTYTTKWDAKA